MKMHRPTVDILDEISDLNMASFYREEFALWRGGALKLLNSGGGCANVARFAKARGFVSECRRREVAVPPLSNKGRDYLAMNARQNWGRWVMLVDTLKEMDV